jgi:phosphoadenosine phosphosulfate reductase
VIERDKRYGLLKVNPLVAWTLTDVWAFIRANDVPYNPLHDAGYPSIGCWPCTTPVAEGEDPRAGRWRGFQKERMRPPPEDGPVDDPSQGRHSS